MPKINSLWPSNLVASTQRMPEDALREQARALETATGGVLRGLVEPGSHGEWLTFNFYVVAPLLDDYSYRLFKVRHKVPNPFNPLEIIVDSKDLRKVADEGAYKSELAVILGSKATRSIIGELLALSRNVSLPKDAEESVFNGLG
jgi:hypothetical protein